MCILNPLSSPLLSKAMIISGFYIFFLASAFMSADTFSSTESHTKNHKRRGRWAVEQKVGWWMGDGVDTPSTVMTTRAPAVLKIEINLSLKS